MAQTAEYMRRWRKENPEKERDTKRRYRTKHRDRYNAKQREHYRKHRTTRLERMRKYNRTVNYGLTSGEYDAMLKAQENKCAICGTEFTEKSKPHIDHDHSCCDRNGSCGKCVRGLLCLSCNGMLGLANDRVDVFQSAIAYLGMKK